MSEFDFTARKVKRGRITNLRTGDTLQFALNPSTIDVGAGSNFAKDPIAGSSHPLLRWMSSKSRTIAFTLFHDGEITIRVFNTQLPNAAKQVEVAPRTWGSGPGVQQLVDGPDSYSIAGALEFLDQFTYPVDPSLPGSDGGADRVILSFGSYLSRVVCTVEDVKHSITEFDPDLNPTKARSTITLERYATETTFANKIWAPLGSMTLK